MLRPIIRRTSAGDVPVPRKVRRLSAPSLFESFFPARSRINR
jgi:hypothetical protein